MSAAPERDQQDLFSELSHKLRTPLAVIGGYAELLLLHDNARIRAEAPVQIGNAAERLGLAIDEFLSVLEADPALARRFVGDRQPETTAQASSPDLLRALPDAARRLLLVDDDGDIRELVRLTLPEDNFEILEARDGNEALAMLGDELPDLIVLDWMMPERTGPEVLEELARRKLQLPVIVLTAESEPAQQARAEALGANAFLTKPFSPLALLREIERHLA